jgi:alanyl aminopeptidase
MRPNEILRVPSIMVRRSAGGQAQVWPWLTANYDAITSRIPAMFHPFLSRLAASCEEERIEAAEAFFNRPDHHADGIEGELARTVSQIRDCASLRAREQASIESYLSEPVGAN